MLKEFELHRKVAPVKFSPYEVTSFVVPSNSGASEDVYTLLETQSIEKKLLFSSIYTASYLIFTLNKATDAYKGFFVTIVPKFINYLNHYEITPLNRVNIIKSFEAFRVEVDQVKVQSTGMAELIRLLDMALNYQPFGLEHLSVSHFDYLDAVSKTVPAASDESSQTTLTDYFAFHSWLRRDDIGVGHELFNRIASPKSLIGSFCSTVSTALVQINEAKHKLIEIFKKEKINSNYFPILGKSPKQVDYEGGNKNPQFKKDNAAFKKETLNFNIIFFQKLWDILSKYSEDTSVKIAVDSIIYAQCPLLVRDYVREVFWNSGKLTKQATISGHGVKTLFNHNTDDSLLFSLGFVSQLAKFVNSEQFYVPVAKGENALFALLMSHKTVPTTDLYLLTLKGFRFGRNQIGDVKVIESDYFKSRAQRVYSLETILASSLLGKAVLCYLKDKTSNLTNDTTFLINEEEIHQTKSGSLTKAASFFNFLATSNIRNFIDDDLVKNSSTTVFVDCMNLICLKGITKEKYNRTNNNWEVNCKTPTLTRLFSFEAIKNTSVHAESDKYDPTKLLNHRSHTNETEKESYLTEQNAERHNNCGRVVRAVMHDLQLNVLQPSKSDLVTYNSAYTEAVEVITKRANYVLARLKVVSNKKNGRVDELGFLKAQDYIQGELPDTIYLSDEANTVLKLRHYTSELERNISRLKERAPEFLFLEALPTAEWIETVFSQRLFSRNILLEGEKMYVKYKNDLPPLFTAQTGAY